MASPNLVPQKVVFCHGLLVVCLGSVAMPWASAAKLYNVTLNYPTEVRGTELKPVLTEFEIAGDKAMIHGQEQTVEATIKVQEGD